MNAREELERVIKPTLESMISIEGYASPSDVQSIIEQGGDEIAQAILDARFIRLEDLSLKQVIDWWIKTYPDDVFVTAPPEIVGIRNLMIAIKQKMAKGIIKVKEGK